MKKASTQSGAYLEITKPRIILMVLITTAIGFFLGTEGAALDASLLLWTLLGTALTAAGAGALNSAVEREPDSKMDRTRFRPIPQKTISPVVGMLFGLGLTLSGVILLQIQVNLLTSFLALLTVFLYVLVYTPLKQITWLNTFVGAVPGALPILMGWTAAANSLNLYAWILFLILFVWQHPHFYAIAWMYKDDYAKGGFQMLPVIDVSGERTFFHVIVYSILLIVFSLMPTFLHMTGLTYAVGAALLGLLVLGCGIRFVKNPTRDNARVLLRSTLVYFPLILALIIWEQS